MRAEKKKTGNRGEWSEPYVLLRLLGTGKLFAADEKLNRIEKMYFPIIKIIRENENGGQYSYLLVREGEDGKDLTKNVKKIKISKNNEMLMEISADKCIEEAGYLLKEIKRGSNNGARVFRVERTEEFAGKIFVTKTKSSSNKKSDIDMEIHDIHTGFERIVGFSIKSKLGSPPTLLNASGATKFIYCVEGISPADIEKLNLKKTGRERFDAICSEGGRLLFEQTHSNTFSDNLKMIDSRMPEILAQLLMLYCGSNKSRCTDLIDLIKKGASSLPKNFYEYKIKELLCAAALGMKPAKPWYGYDEATGGYIVVKNDGDVVAYHLYNRDLFKNYLLAETKFDTPDSRLNFGYLYEKNGKVFIDLCLQIRFC